MLELRRGFLTAGDLRVDDAMQSARRGWNEEMEHGWTRLCSLPHGLQELLGGGCAVGHDEHVAGGSGHVKPPARL